MTKTYIKHYGKLYEYDRSTRFKKDAEALARDWRRDGDKVAVIRKGKAEFGSKKLGTHEVHVVYDVYWRRK